MDPWKTAGILCFPYLLCGVDIVSNVDIIAHLKNMIPSRQQLHTNLHHSCTHGKQQFCKQL